MVRHVGTEEVKLSLDNYYLSLLRWTPSGAHEAVHGMANIPQGGLIGFDGMAALAVVPGEAVMNGMA